MLSLNVHSIVSQSPLAQRSQSPKVFFQHNSTQTCGQMQGITPTVPQLPFLSSYGGFGPFGAGHRLKLDKLCIYGTYCIVHTCKSL